MTSDEAIEWLEHEAEKAEAKVAGLSRLERDPAAVRERARKLREVVTSIKSLRALAAMALMR